MMMNTSNHSPEMIIVDDATVLRLGGPACCFCTYETGRACVRVPAYPDACAGAERSPSLKITTEKIGDLVVLRVDE